MSRASFGATVIVVCAGLCGVFATASQAASGGCAGASAVPVDAAGRAQAASAVVCLVNRSRAARRLRALRVSGQLGLAARGHSDDMVARKYFAHDSPTGDTLTSRLQRCGYAASHPGFDVGEALAWGEEASPAALVAALMRSAVHRHVLLAAGARRLGIGLALGAPAGGVAAPSSTLVLDVGA